MNRRRRMKPGNYTEMTAVCVPSIAPRPRLRRKALLGAVGPTESWARGEIPFLHVFSNNESAIALYRRQGMGNP